MNQTYNIACIAENSKPDLNLVIYGTNQLIPVSNNENSVLKKSCNSLGLCSNILEVQFKLEHFKLLNGIDSITCQAESNDKRVDLSLSISLNVSIESEETSLTTEDYSTILTSIESTTFKETTEDPLSDIPKILFNFQQITAFINSNYTIVCPFKTPIYWTFSNTLISLGTILKLFFYLF